MAAGSLSPKTVIVPWIGGCFLAAVVLIHFGLIGLGQCLGDEYADFGATRTRWMVVSMG